ncbi:MFS transporter [Paenibacillus sp. ACRRX]|uniref:MFS transporter n=1 Tax=Paenibacillus sp. ACRRX TaxID=2918206 RepID=UPI001EF482EE|nr:MFS transporter [Paenibacillus sp. ACRRX]MCG7408288.1 MFS transporter [Paenibacillus sp. ACRRX]
MSQRVHFPPQMHQQQGVHSIQGVDAVQPPRQQEKPVMVGWLITAALFTAALNLRPAITAVAPLLGIIRTDLGLNAAIASLLTSIPVLCMGCLSPLSTRLGRKYGLEQVIAWSLVLITAGTLLRLVTDSVFTLLATTVLIGLGVATMGPLLSGFIKKHFPTQIAAMIAVYTTALSLGAALGSGLSSPLQLTADSWQTALALWSLLAAAALPIWLIVIRRQAEAPTLSSVPLQGPNMPWKETRAWLLTLHFGLLAMVFYSLMAWLPAIMESLGHSHDYAAYLLTIYAVVQIPSGFLLQLLLRRVPSRKAWLLCASLMQLLGLALILCSTPAWAAVSICGLGSGMLFSLASLLPVDTASTPEEAASWAAMTQSVGYLIGALGPLLIGWIKDMTHQFEIAILGLSLITLILMGLQISMAARHMKAAS